MNIITMLAATAAHYNLPPNGYAVKPVGWALTINPDGTTNTFTPTIPETRAGRGGKNYTSTMRLAVPDSIRTNGIAPRSLCDDGTYVCGAAGPTTKNTSKKHQAWLDQALAWATANPELPEADIIARWIKNGQPGLQELLPTDPKELVALTESKVAIFVDGRLVHDHPAAVAAWQQHLIDTKSSTTGTCAVCSKNGPLMDTFPTGIPQHLVPGASQSTVALTSANFATAQRDVRGDKLAPMVCFTCATDAVAAYNHFAADPDHRWKSTDSITLWRLREPGIPDIIRMINGNPTVKDVRAAYDQVFTGKPNNPFDPGTEFHAITCSGNAARLVLRNHITSTLGTITQNIHDYFDRSAVQRCDGRSPYAPVWVIANALGVYNPNSREPVTPLHSAYETIITTAITGRNLPPHHLAAAVTRSRAEIGLRDGPEEYTWRDREHARAIVVRLILNQHLEEGEVPYMSHLDDTRIDTPYLLGRLFAEYENLQRAAMGSKVNATITDRHYAAAMTTPLRTYPTLDQLSKAHLKKLRTQGKETTAAVYLRRIRGIVDMIGGFPATLPTASQGAWMLGYYQQQQHNIEAAIAAKASKEAAAETVEIVEQISV